VRPWHACVRRACRPRQRLRRVGMLPGAPITAWWCRAIPSSPGTSWAIKGVDWMTANAHRLAVANMSIGGLFSFTLDCELLSSGSHETLNVSDRFRVVKWLRTRRIGLALLVLVPLDRPRPRNRSIGSPSRRGSQGQPPSANRRCQTSHEPQPRAQTAVCMQCHMADEGYGTAGLWGQHGSGHDCKSAPRDSADKWIRRPTHANPCQRGGRAGHGPAESAAARTGVGHCRCKRGPRHPVVSTQLDTCCGRRAQVVRPRDRLHRADRPRGAVGER
jgi:hypothetical protein